MKKFLLSIFALMLAVFSVQAQSYVKVTSALADWSGDYLIVYETGNVAFNGSLTTLDAVSNTIDVTISGGKIAANNETNAAKFTISSNGIIRSASGYSIGQTSNANGLKASTSTNYTNTITINNDGSANIVSSGAYLRYNSANDQKRFRYYKSSSYTGQKAIALYKYTEEGGSTEPEIPVDPETPEEPETPLAPGEYTDELTIESIGVTYSSYTDWDGVRLTSTAVYAGNSYKNNDAIQLRSSNSNSGIVTKKSGGKAKKVSIEWSGNSTRTLNIYGKNTPYESPTDLYNTEKQGNLLGTIVGGRSTELVIDGDYQYIGMRSNSGAMYLNWIKVTWVVEEVEETESYTLAVGETGYATLYLDFAATIPADVDAYIVTGVKEGNWLNMQIVEGTIPANTGIIVNAEKGNYTFTASTEEATDVTGNLLEGTVADENIHQGEAYVLANGKYGIGLYKAEMNGTSWLNNANKAYLPASAVSASGASSASLRFDFGGTTAIEEVETEVAETVIYDLTGRRVNKITKAGVYIINGKKILVK